MVYENVSLKKYNTYGIGGNTRYLYKPKDILELKKVLKFLNDNNISYFILGNGSNIILPDEDYDGAVILLSNFKGVKIDNNTLEVEAGATLPYLNKFLLEKGYTNFTWASSIPGTIGGAIIGNAGAYNHDIFEYLINITYLKNNKIYTLSKNNIEYGYHYTNLKNVIIIKAKFKLEQGNVDNALKEMKEQFEKRKSTQPLECKNAGSVFKNPLGFSAGKLIDEANLKGKRIGGAMISKKHANFIVNHDNASSKDIKDLIEYIKKIIKKKYNINLELEQKIIKWK